MFPPIGRERTWLGATGYKGDGSLFAAGDDLSVNVRARGKDISTPTSCPPRSRIDRNPFPSMGQEYNPTT